MNTIALIGNILWIFGIAIIVSAHGWHLWQARLLDTISGGESSKYGLDAGIFFFCFGISLSTNQSWARILFLLIATSIIVITLIDLISTAKELR
jgi:hypothetical protein